MASGVDYFSVGEACIATRVCASDLKISRILSRDPHFMASRTVFDSESGPHRVGSPACCRIVRCGELRSWISD